MVRPPGNRMASNSATRRSSFSRRARVSAVLGVSTSSGRIRLARPPVSCPNTPRLRTLAACDGGAPSTSKLILLHRDFSLFFGINGRRTGTLSRSCCANVEKSSARSFAALTTRTCSDRAFASAQTPYAAVIQDFPTPRYPNTMIRLFGASCGALVGSGPCWRYPAMSYCTGVGSGSPRHSQTCQRKFRKSSNSFGQGT